MRLTPWLSLFAKSPTRRDVQARRRSRPVVNVVEGLEDRVLLSTFYVDSTPGDGNDFAPAAGSHTGVNDLTVGVDLFTTIGGAIAAAAANGLNNGDIILVADGTYAEGNSVTEDLTIRGNQFGVNAESGRVGANETIINFANGSFAITGAGATIDGFTLEGQTTAGGPGFGSNVRLVPGSSATSILNNIIQNNTVGVFLTNAGPGQTLIQANLFRNNNNPGAASGHDIYADQFTAGVGGVTNVLIDNNTFTNSSFQVNAWAIGISNTNATPFTNIDVTNNDISNHGRGMYFFSTDDATITGNTITGVTNYGIGVFDAGVAGTESSNFVINGNTITGTGPGVSIDAGGYTGPIVNTNNGTVEVFGTAGNDTATLKFNAGVLELTVGANVYNLTGATSIDFDGFTGSDTLTLDFSGGVFAMPINFAGGSGPGGENDELATSGGTFATGVVTSTGVGAGTIQYTGAGLITFSGLEPVTDDNVVADYTINGTGAADAITIANNGDGTRTLVSAATFESVAFSNKTNVTVDGAGGTDSVTLGDNSDPADGLSSLTVLGESVDVAGALTFAAGTLTLTSPAITHTSGAVSLTTLNLNGPVSQTGGTITVSGLTTITAAASNVTLNQANDFNDVNVVSGNAVAVTDANAINLTAATATSLTITATGAVSDSGNLAITNASFSGSTITLGGGAETTNFGSLTFNSAGAVIIQEDTSTLIAGVNTAGSLDLTSVAGISDAGATSTLVGANTHVTGTSIDLGTGAATFNTTSLTFNSAGTVTIAEDSGLDLSGASTAGPLNLTVTGNITESGTVAAGATSLTADIITMNGANVLGNLTVNNGTGAVSITENDAIAVAGITHTSGTLTLQAGANPITVNGPIVINTAGNVNFLTTGTLNLNNNVTAAGVIMGTPVIVNVNNNTAQIQDGVDAALAGATVNMNAAVTFSENVSVPKNLTLLATLDNVTISGGAGGAALTVTAGTVSATGFYMNTAAASSTVNVTGGSLTLRDNVIVESSGFAQAAITVGGAGALNMGVNATSTPGNNSITLNGAGTLLSNAVPVDASGNYWGSSVFATITAGISSPATVDYSPYLNVGTNLAGIGFQGDYSDLTAHAAGSQLGVAAITEAYNMLTATGTIHALTGSYTETVDLGAGANKAVTFHAGASPGQVVISGDFILTANDTLPIELTAYVAPDAAGPTAESTVSDNFTVSGTINLGGATLLPIVTYAAQPFERFTIINNLNAGAVVGTFAGAAEGFIYNVGGVRLRISYVEFHNPGSLPATPSFFGDGNDVSLTVMTPPVLVELTTSGTLNITGTGWVDDFDLEVSGTNQITLRGNDVTNFQFGNLNTQILGPITVTGNINLSLGNSNDRVLLRGVGVGATFDSGNVSIDLGSGNDSVSTTDITAPITLTTGLTLTGDLSILGGTGDDVISLGGLAAADTFAANAISIDTGTGGIQTVSLDRTTVGTDVTIKNGGTTGLQTVALGVNGPDSIGRNLIITQADGATGYTVGIHETNVGGFVNVTNGGGSGAAVVTIDTTTATARTIGGSTTITNGNNVTNAVSLVGTVGTLKLTGNVTVKNGTATTSNDITVTDLLDSGTTASTFTNGASPDNAILFDGALRNTFLGSVAATNGASTGTNSIVATRLSSTKGINLINGNATTSNLLTVGGTAAATDRVNVTGNLVLTNGNAGTNTVNIGGLTTLGQGNVTIRNGTSGAGGTAVTVGAGGVAPGANTLNGNLSIANLSSTGLRAVTLDRLTVNGTTGVAVNESVSGNSTLDVGTLAGTSVVIGGKLDIQDGSSTSTATLSALTAGSITYNDLGGGADIINMANAVGFGGTLQVNGVTRLNLGAGSDVVNIAAAVPGTGGTAIFNDSVFISLGAGNDILRIGANAASPAFSSARRFQIDGATGVDSIFVDPVSMADYVGGVVPKKLKSKITNFENINLLP